MSAKLTITGCLLFALATFTIGCTKPSPEEQSKKEAALASALASGMLALPSTPATTTTTSGTPGAFAGSCTDTETQLCNEFLGALPMGAEDSCKVMNGSFSNTTRCPTDKLGKAALAGICTIKTEGDDRIKRAHSYVFTGTTLKVTAENAKAMCDVQSGTFEAAQESVAPLAKAVPKAPSIPVKKKVEAAR